MTRDWLKTFAEAVHHGVTERLARIIDCDNPPENNCFLYAHAGALLAATELPAAKLVPVGGVLRLVGIRDGQAYYAEMPHCWLEGVASMRVDLTARHYRTWLQRVNAVNLQAATITDLWMPPDASPPGVILRSTPEGQASSEDFARFMALIIAETVALARERL